MRDTQNSYLDALRSRILVFDGAMGTSLLGRNLTADDYGGKGKEGWVDGLVFSSPQVIEDVHRSFLTVGCDVVETCTFQSTHFRLAEWGSRDRTIELNRSAAQIARRACDAFATAEHPRFVAGSIGPTGFLPSSDDPALGNVTFPALVEAYAEQAEGLMEGGADLFLIETAQDILEVKASIHGVRAAMTKLGREVPIQVHITLDTSGRMLLGTDIGAALAILEGLRIDAIGLNCSTGPEFMREPIAFLCSNTAMPVVCVPNAGIPLNVDGQAVFPLQPQPMAKELRNFVESFGVNAVGGCCGTTPEHIRLLVEQVGHKQPTARSVTAVPHIASSIRSYTVRQEPAPLLIGERVNAQGSRAIKRLLLDDDYDGILSIARDQVEGGAHALDVCVAVTERSDEAEQMRHVVKKLQLAIETPLVFDSTDANVIKAALETYPGRPIVNSVNLEDGRTRCDAVLPLVRDHGAYVIALTIDEQGMAKDRHRKLEIAERIATIACDEYSLHPSQLLFDALTFTLATGQEEWLDSAVETIEGIRLIKQRLPNVNCVLGVSNVSFGLSPASRHVLNSVFLYYCIEAGLDAAIINPAHVVPFAEISADMRSHAEAVIFNRAPDALTKFIGLFDENVSTINVAGKADPFAGMSAPERIHAQILQRRKDGIEEQIDIAVTQRDPVAVLNEILLPAMKEVGDRFGAGELILPFVLQSAEVMKRAVTQLEKYLDKAEGQSKGTVVLATVYGDVHDIGKNLVKTIISNNGYTVHDLGKQVPVNTIIEKALEVNADAIGLSALLVSTSKQMPLCLQELDARGLAYPVIIGGAAINRPFGRRILYLNDEKVYGPGVFYCKDAFEGLETVEELVDAERRPALVERIYAEAATNREREIKKSVEAIVHAQEAPPVAARSEVRVDVPIPQPPFWGPKLLTSIDPEDVYPCIDRNSLFKMSWQFRGIRDKEKWAEMVREELEPRLQLCKDEVAESGYIKLQAAYGYWPALAEGDTVVVYDPEDHDKEIGRFTFPRQAEHRRLCLADYIRPAHLAADGERDVVTLSVVTTGPEASERSNALQVSGDYDAMLRVHGFATQMAEATAEYLHRYVRRELNLPEEQGLRYSWGYPACPDLDQHETVFSIVPADEIGVVLTDGFQLVPEQSTAAIIMHHPESVYFAIYRSSGVTAEVPVPS